MPATAPAPLVTGAPRLAPETLADAAMDGTRAPQLAWAATPIRQRLHLLRAFRHLLAENVDAQFTRAIPRNPRPHARRHPRRRDPPAPRCLPLSRAERRPHPRPTPPWPQGPALLARRHRRHHRTRALRHRPHHRPSRTTRSSSPARTTLQALAAGNAVVWKPGRGGEPVARLFTQLARASRLARSASSGLPTTPSKPPAPRSVAGPQTSPPRSSSPAPPRPAKPSSSSPPSMPSPSSPSSPDATPSSRFPPLNPTASPRLLPSACASTAPPPAWLRAASSSSGRRMRMSLCFTHSKQPSTRAEPIFLRDETRAKLTSPA